VVKLDFLASEYDTLKRQTDREVLPWIVLTIVVVLGVSLAIFLLPSIFSRSSILYPIFAGVIVLLSILHRHHGKAESAFWKLFTERNHGAYSEKGNMDGLPGAVLFRQGFKREIGHHAVFTYEKERIALYAYTYYTKHTDSKGNEQITPHPFTVFDVSYDGKTPHIGLNYRKDFLNIFDGRKLPLPQEFEKRFTMYTPEQYEIEALTLFTPDILQFMLDQNIKADIELVEGHVLFFIPKRSFGFWFVVPLAELEQQYRAVSAIFEKLEPALDTFDFETIGTHEPVL